MSAPDDSYAKPKTAEERPSRSSGGSSTRLLVLLAILAVAGVAAGWDYLVARPGRTGAIKKLEPLFPPKDAGHGEANEGSGDNWKASTQKDVHALLGEEPAGTETAGAYLVERYSWRRGIPWMTYDLYVIYDDDSMRMLRNATTEREEVEMYFTSTPLSEYPPIGPDDSGMSPADPEELEHDHDHEGAGETPNAPAPEAPASADSSAPAADETEPAPAAESPANESP